MRTPGGFIVGLILGVVSTPLAVYFYFVTGNAPVATAAPPMPFEKNLAHKALNAKIRKEMPQTVPIQADEPNLVAGVKVYQDHCAVCHGLPGQPESAIATGMFPRPPKLMEGKGVTDDEPGESYWKVANGIRLTGMPGFKGRLTDFQLWQVSQLLANADKISPTVKTALAAPLAASSAVPATPPVVPTK